MSHPEACPALFHVGITVADLDRALAFYRDGLGLTVQSDRVAESPTLATLTGVSVTRLRIALLDAPGGGVFELLQYDDGAMGEPLPASRAGTGHVCVFVDDLGEATARLLAFGGTQVSAEPVTVSGGEYAGRRCVYLRDPDGYLVELFTGPGPR
ncbi:MAG TPA: VOC family protein [Nocardioides sp.]|uniref:VOC family protein n=1 Tax=uncultured Nocardioides sp. TaxID=198441 RepID=UPI0026083501|nr:VOC family protein [uncultured Nocardioides sp.]HRD59619.1 VOC family protein [Nocardioides sp.]HRI94240.1 VOC family protein [Nocardioides sp.]HRK44307.1 VOC family protein [Nocardioides sp.]